MPNYDPSILGSSPLGCPSQCAEFWYKLEAQRTLCQNQIELNTRGKSEKI